MSYAPVRYSVVSRRKGTRRAYSDGYIYADLDYTKQEAKNKSLTGLYSMVKVVNYETNELIEKYTKSKQ